MEVDVPSDETLSQLVITEYTFSWWGAKVMGLFVRVQLLLASWVSVYWLRRMWRAAMQHAARHIAAPTHTDSTYLWDLFNWGYPQRFWTPHETRCWVEQRNFRETLCLRPALDKRCGWHGCVLPADGGRTLQRPPPLGSGRWSDGFCSQPHQLLHAYHQLLAFPAHFGSAWYVEGGPEYAVGSARYVEMRWA